MFLLQNWWKRKPFVEVSAEYLAVCQPTFYFCKKAITTMPKGVAINMTSASEFLDMAGDGYIAEY